MMISKTIFFDGNEYTRMRHIKSEKKVYVEYRNQTLRMIKFFEVERGKLQEITDKEDLKKAIDNNYITEKNQ